ncbi:MAG: DUF2721 domain-containing protein [Chthoniobacter sp.]|nr:DUF2721 domain-containing protein [Chthoniobacter sp.]
MAGDPSLISNPFAALSFIAAPAVLTNAASVLAMSTSNRFLRASDRMRQLADRLDRGVDTEATLAMFRVQVGRVEKQAVLLLHGLVGAYIALGSFAGASLVSICGAVLGAAEVAGGAHLAVVLALIVGVAGVCGLIYSSVNLFRATRLSMLNIIEEAALIRDRHTRREGSVEPA